MKDVNQNQSGNISFSKDTESFVPNRPVAKNLSQAGMSNQINIKLIRSLSDLEPHAEAWDRLVGRQPEQLPFNSHAWIATYLQNRLAEKDQWCCMLAYDGSELIGVLPLIITPCKVFGFKRWQLQNPKGAHTRSVGAVAAPERESEAIEAFLLSLNNVVPGWHSVYFERIPVSSTLIRYLDRGADGILAYHEFSNWGAYLPTIGDFDNFRAGLKKSSRTNLTTAHNRLSHHKDVHYEFYSGETAKPADLERFMKIEVANWKGEVGSAIIQSPDLVSFYSQLAERLARRDWLEWQFLQADSKTIAGNLAFRCCRSIFIWKLGYDVDYAKCSPGNMLFEQVVKRAFESGEIDKIELISDPSWAKIWNMQKREFHNLWIYPAHPMPYILNIAPKVLKNKLKQIPFFQAAIERFHRLLHQG